MNLYRLLLLLSSLLLTVSGSALAGVDHSDFVKDPFKEGPDVTKQCLQCHEKQATDVMKTTH
jgi:hypothetical protein